MRSRPIVGVAALLAAVTLVPSLAAQGQVQAGGGSTHVVKRGDTLWGIARQYQNDPFLWPAIYKLNTDRVADPHWIYPGQELRLQAGEGVAAVPAERDGSAESAARAAATGDAADTLKQQVAAAPAAAPAQPEGPAMPAVEADPADTTPLFPRANTLTAPGAYLTTVRLDNYRPLRPHEFYAAGFLTEDQALPFGRVLGRTSKAQIASTPNARAVAFPGQVIALDPPAGAKYTMGDSILVVELGERTIDHGRIVEARGLARVVGTESGKTLAEVLAIFGPIREGQLALPAERFVPGPRQRATPISDGVRGLVVAWPGRQELKEPQHFLFIDRGRKDGVRPGDLFEITRPSEVRLDGTVTQTETIGRLQVVHVRERTASAIILSVREAVIPAGTPVKQVARLPG